jgi:hypothetical protein
MKKPAPAGTATSRPERTTSRLPSPTPGWPPPAGLRITGYEADRQTHGPQVHPCGDPSKWGMGGLKRARSCSLRSESGTILFPRSEIGLRNVPARAPNPGSGHAQRGKTAGRGEASITWDRRKLLSCLEVNLDSGTSVRGRILRWEGLKRAPDLPLSPPEGLDPARHLPPDRARKAPNTPRICPRRTGSGYRLTVNRRSRKRGRIGNDAIICLK